MKSLRLSLLAISFLVLPGVNACESEAEPASAHTDACQPACESDVQDELDRIRVKVLRRCGLSRTLAENRLPWYFYYEYGVELINQGASARAIEPLQMTANLRTQPAREVRMYGMWFVDYLPYYHLSLAWAELGEWDKAWEAMRLSEELLEFSPSDFDYEKYIALKRLIEKHKHSVS